MSRRGTIETARLRLEPWDERHTEMLVRLSAMPEITRYIGPGTPWPRSQALDVATLQLRHWKDHGFGWRGATDKATGELVGLLALNFAGDGTAGLDPHEYEIGWWIAPAAWGRGFAREGAAAMRDEAFDALGAPSVIARIQPANAPSIAVAEATGLALDFTTTGKSGEPVAVYRAMRPAR